MRHLPLAVLTAAILFFSAASKVDARDYYGAFAVGNNGGYGLSWDFPTKQAAQNRAMSECRARTRNCRSALWFRNACGALAMNRSKSWATAWGSNRGTAERIALRNCNNKFGGCFIKHWACTTRPR